MSVVTKEGDLFKYRNMLSGWAKRYCKLDRNYLHYFTTRFDNSPVASAIRGDIMRAAPTQPGWTQHPFSFEVTQRDGTTWYFRASDQVDMDSWLMALNAGPTRRTVKLALESHEAQVYGSCSDQIVPISETKPTARTSSGGVQTHHHAGVTSQAQAHVQPQAQAHMQYQPQPHAQLQPALQHTQPPSYNPNWRPEEQAPAAAVPHAGFATPAAAAAPAAYGHVDYGRQHPTAPSTGPAPPPSYMQATDTPPGAPSSHSGYPS